MRLNYKQLSKYIRKVNVRNVDLKTTSLLGINIDKYFMPSVANIVGTDMSVYKVVKKGQFACNRMHVGRDYKLPVALSDSLNDFLVSPAYDVFEVKDSEELLPEYLMMWFSRQEHDRNAWFYTDADVRGGLNWNAFIEMELPVPHIDKQKEIVKEYNVLVDRINLNNKLIQKLEETALAIYKQWFIDFEFPDENGKPYKSNGGEMEFNKDMEKDIPKGWNADNLGKFFPIITGKKNVNIATAEGIYPFFTCSKDIYYTDTFSFDSTSILLTGNGEYNVKWFEGKFEAYQRTYVLTPYDKTLTGFLFYSIKYFLRDITNGDRGSVISFITRGMIDDFQIAVESIVLQEMSGKFNILNKSIRVYELEVANLIKLKNLLLSKIVKPNN